jgi:predicted P-loop ATPase
MRNLAIAYGSSRQAKTWTNKTITYAELKERLKVTIRTPESAEEYAKFSKTKRDEVKDHGGFVAGALKGGRRKIDTVELRSMLALDGDRIDKAFLENYEENAPYTSLLYTTHSSTEENPRVRLVYPLTRDVTAEEFVAVSRYLAEMLGIDYFDECSYQPNQLMYWPSTPSNGVFVYKEVEKEWIDPDVILSAHPEWTDPTRLPTSSRESRANTAGTATVQDPLDKEGTIGIFNRTFFPITRAMEKFLSDVYEPTDNENRWHYKQSSSMAGVEIIEDGKFAYSHHAKDPAYLKLCNAFDLVRIHKFGDDTEKKSFNAMCELAMEDDEVKRLVMEEKLKQAEEDFNDSGDDWLTKLKYQPRTGQLENSVYNLNLILNNDPDFQHFAFNELANRIEITGPLPWERPKGNKFWRDADTAQLKSVIDIRYLAFSGRNHDVAFTKVADDRHFHPIRDYLDSLPEWDGVKRVEEIFIKYLKADDTEYVRTVTRKTFAAAVARIYSPGIKYDCVTVLDGGQGIGKSTIIKDLVTSEFYSETLSLTDMEDKAGAEKLQGFWAVEIGELAGMKKADVEKVKAFLSVCDDKYRPSYGRVVESHPRQCFIIATVNGERGYLRDITGNRRFWIVKLHQKKQKQKWDFTPEFRAQFWAEAKEVWNAGETLFLEDEMLEEAEKIQQSAMEVDERVGMVEEYLNTMLPDDWESMDLFQRRNYLQGSEFGTPVHKGSELRTEVSNAEIWCECFGKSLQELKPTDSYSIAALMTQIPRWERTTTIKRQPIYGRQRLYKFGG